MKTMGSLSQVTLERDFQNVGPTALLYFTLACNQNNPQTHNYVNRALIRLPPTLPQHLYHILSGALGGGCRRKKEAKF